MLCIFSEALASFSRCNLFPTPIPRIIPICCVTDLIAGMLILALFLCSICFGRIQSLRLSFPCLTGILTELKFEDLPSHINFTVPFVTLAGLCAVQICFCVSSLLCALSDVHFSIEQNFFNSPGLWCFIPGNSHRIFHTQNSCMYWNLTRVRLFLAGWCCSSARSCSLSNMCECVLFCC